MLALQKKEYSKHVNDNVLLDQWYNAKKVQLDAEMVAKNKAAYSEMAEFQAAIYARMAQENETAMGNMFYNMMVDAENWRDHLRNYYKQIAQSFAAMIARMVAAMITFAVV